MLAQLRHLLFENGHPVPLLCDGLWLVFRFATNELVRPCMLFRLVDDRWIDTLGFASSAHVALPFSNVNE